MTGHDHPEAEGPSPSPSDPDPLDELELEIEDLDRPLGAEGRTTAEEGLQGEGLDERLAREIPDQGVGRRPAEPPTLSEEDGPDVEPDLVGDEADVDHRASPEEAAMRIADRAPGATDHPDDYVQE